MDLCQDCVKKNNVPVEDFFEIENSCDEMVFHEYFECDVLLSFLSATGVV